MHYYYYCYYYYYYGHNIRRVQCRHTAINVGLCCVGHSSPSSWTHGDVRHWSSSTTTLYYIGSSTPNGGSVTHFQFLQGVSIACYAEPCITYRRVVHLSVCLSYAGIVSTPQKLGSQNLHRWIAQGL